MYLSKMAGSLQCPLSRPENLELSYDAIDPVGGLGMCYNEGKFVSAIAPLPLVVIFLTFGFGICGRLSHPGSR